MREFNGEQGNSLPGKEAKFLRWLRWRDGEFRPHREGPKVNHLARSLSREGTPSRGRENVLEAPRIHEAAQEMAVREKIGEARRDIEAVLKAGEAAALDNLYRRARELGYIKDPGPR